MRTNILIFTSYITRGYGSSTEECLTYKLDWYSIDWSQCLERLKRMQIAIAVAYKNGDFGKVELLQTNLIKSFAARALAVKAVTTSPGKKLYGVDGVVWKTSSHKCRAILELANLEDYRVSQVKRSWVYMGDGKQHPIVIPTMMDRAVQVLLLYSLEPIAACWGDKHSYAHRPFRGPQDVQTILFNLFSKETRPLWALTTSVDNLFSPAHKEWVINNIPVNKRLLKQLLGGDHLYIPKNINQSGIGLEVSELESVYKPRNNLYKLGALQPLIPMILNMSLDGLADVLSKAAKPYIKRSKVKSWTPKVHAIRYADRIVVTAATKRLIEGILLNEVRTFLELRGLLLVNERTHITSVKMGFDFVGFNFRIYPFPTGPAGYKLLIKPTKDHIIRIRRCIKQICKTHMWADPAFLVRMLNPLLRRWCIYYRTVVSKAAFAAISHYLWYVTWKWCKRKNPSLSHSDLKQKYYTTVGNRHWVFFGMIEGNKYCLMSMARTPIKRHVTLKDINPYLPENQEYFIKRGIYMATRAFWLHSKWRILTKHNFKCLVCGSTFMERDCIEIHHIQPKKMGGTNDLKNLVALHNFCHKQVTYTKSSFLKAKFQQLGVSL